MRFKKLISILFMLAVTYYVQTKSTVKFGWDPSTGGTVDHYELVLIREGTGEQFGPYGMTGSSLTVSKPKSGSYEVKVRAAWLNGDGTMQFTEWCSSVDPACARLKDGTPGQWKVKWKPSAPTGPIIIW